MKTVRTLLFALLALSGLALAATEEVRLDRAPIKEGDLISLQKGAHTFVNYCLGCHSLGYVRYSQLQELGLTEQQIKDYLVVTGAKVGDLMTVAAHPKDAKEWFGTPPPDLSVIARSRSSHAGSGADWLYTYLRGFYRDATRPTGWNNTVFPNVGMPHALYQLQGDQVLKAEEKTLPGGHKEKAQKLALERPGKLSPLEYDRAVADLVNFLVFVGEPHKHSRVTLGIYVLIFLGVLLVLAYALKKEYWKDVH